MAVSKVKKDKKKCSMCPNEKALTQFYMSYSKMDSEDGRVRVCKECLKTKFDINDVDSIKEMLRMLDKPFNVQLWESANNKNDVIGEYFKLINAKDFRNHTWNESNFEEKEIKEKTITNLPINNDYDLEELKEKYGYGYPDDQYYLFEKKFNVLKSSFQLPTPMHEEYLREYCVNKVKETLAKAKGEFKEAKEWANMAKDVADAGKLKPSQMTKADLSQGLDSFGQASRMVEEHYDIISILPKFIERPKDNVDITLWLYINYIRDLKGLPEASYEDIYKFYEERVKEYSSTAFDNLEGEKDE